MTCMGITDGFKRQHEEILDIATDLSALLTVEQIKNKSELARNLLAKLTGKLGAHLTMEDKVLYPRLYKQSNPTISATAKRFFDEMGGLSTTFINYSEKWSNYGAIEKHAEGFIDETQTIFQALSKRIEKENSELYKLADSI